MKLNLILAIFAASLLGGCTPSAHRGSVAMKLDDGLAHMCLGADEVKPGDSIKVLRNICTNNSTPNSKGAIRTKGVQCELKLIGQGKITEILNNHYSVATIEAQGGYQEGDIVERSGS